MNDEILINNNEQIDKVIAVRNGLGEIAIEFAGLIVEASLKLNYSSRVNNNMADLFLYLRWLSNDDSTLMTTITEMLQRSFSLPDDQF